MNHNVVLSFTYRTCDGLVSGIWASSVLSNYINALEGGGADANEKVGLAQAIQGTLLASAALPAGWLAGRIRRDSILRFLALIQLAAIACTAYALLMDQKNEFHGIEDSKFWVLCCGLALWGIAQGNSPVLDALLADSVPTGKRLPIYTRIYICYILSQGLGPALGAAIFYSHGNLWSLEIMEHVMLIGMVGATVPTLILFFFNEDKTLGAESEGLLKSRARHAADEESGLNQPLLGNSTCEGMNGGEMYEDGADHVRTDVSIGDSSDEQNLTGFESPITFSPISSPLKPDGHAATATWPSTSAVQLEKYVPNANTVAAPPVDSFALDISETETVYSGSSRASSYASLLNDSSKVPLDGVIVHRELASVAEGSPEKRPAATSPGPSAATTAMPPAPPPPKHEPQGQGSRGASAPGPGPGPSSNASAPTPSRSAGNSEAVGGAPNDGTVTFWTNSPPPPSSSNAVTPTKVQLSNPTARRKLDHPPDDASTPSLKARAKPPHRVLRGAREQLSVSATARAAATEAPAILSAPDAGHQLSVDMGGRCCCLTVRSIPYIMAFSDCIMALASGMTVKFFPIFYKDEVGLSPTVLNLMYTCIPLSLAVMSYLSQHQCRLMGRVLTIATNRMIGISLLFVITAFPELWTNAPFMMVTGVVRFSIMNANYPIQKSILMDWVPKSSRALWNSVESINIFGWSGSAAMGGWLIARYGFQNTFAITASMQSIGWVISLLLIPIVPSDKARRPA